MGMSGKDQRRVVAFIIVCLALAGLLWASTAHARPPVPGPIFKAVRAEWHSPANRRKAFDIIACETGDTYYLGSTNGQYLGMFQMGREERRQCGHGTTAREQARAARCWYDRTGHDFGAWSCA